MNDGSPGVAGLQPGAVRVDVVGQDAPRADPDDLRRQVAVGRGLARAGRGRDGLGGAANLKEPEPAAPRSGAGTSSATKATFGFDWTFLYLALRAMFIPAMSMVPSSWL